MELINETVVKPANKTSQNGNRLECGTNKIKIIAVIVNFALIIDQQPCNTWIDQFDTFDLQAHLPLHEGGIAINRDRGRHHIEIITTLDQALLCFQVSLDSLSFLGRVNEMHLLVVKLAPICLCWGGFAVGLCEQSAKTISVHGILRESGSNLMRIAPEWSNALVYQD